MQLHTHQIASPLGDRWYTNVVFTSAALAKPVFGGLYASSDDRKLQEAAFTHCVMSGFPHNTTPAVLCCAQPKDFFQAGDAGSLSLPPHSCSAQMLFADVVYAVESMRCWLSLRCHGVCSRQDQCEFIELI